MTHSTRGLHVELQRQQFGGRVPAGTPTDQSAPVPVGGQRTLRGGDRRHAARNRRGKSVQGPAGPVGESRR